MSGPCKGCKERWVIHDEDGKARTCHGECEKYKAFRAKKDELIEKRSEIVAQTTTSYISLERVKRKTGWYQKQKNK